MPEPFDVPYMQRALLAGLLLAVPLGLLGTWILLRALAFFAHAAGVATFPGVVLGLGVPAIGPFAGALVAALGFTGTVALAEGDRRVRGGAATGLVLATALALGALLLTAVFTVSAPVESVLFGSLLAISDADVARAAAVAVLASAGVVAALPRLAAASFDPVWAEAAGGRPETTGRLLLVAVALAVVTAVPAVGSLLVSGLLVVPAATARLLTDRLGPLLATSVALCAGETVAGLAVARGLDVPPGAAVATLAGGAFAVAALAAALTRGPASATAA